MCLEINSSLHSVRYDNKEIEEPLRVRDHTCVKGTILESLSVLFRFPFLFLFFMSS